MDQAALYAFLAGFRYGVLSSATRHGTPQSALVGIAVTSRLEIIFDTLQSSRKYSNLIQQPACSFVIGWGGEQSVQYEGIAREPQGEELTRVREEYFAIWPECRSHLEWPGLTHFLVRPRWIRYSDFDASPPRILETRFPSTRSQEPAQPATRGFTL